MTALVAASAGGVWTAVGGSAGGAPDDATFTGATAVITRGDLRGTTSVAGTLTFAGSRSVRAGAAGTITTLPRAGRMVRFDQRLYSVDNLPTILLPGRVPAWRAIGTGMSDGPDVEQLERALDELGLFLGDVDERFTSYTAEAIRDWQESHGLERTGSLALGSVVFAPAELRVAAVAAKVGDLVAPGVLLLTASRTTKVVEARVKLANQQLAVPGARVAVRLPGGASTTGTITALGTPTEVESGDGQKQSVIPVVIRLGDPEEAADLQEASVTVELPSGVREGVLIVPVGALIALTPDQYAVEVVEPGGATRKVPVTPGLFAAGRVEIRGDVRPGQSVVVPQR